MSHPFQLPRLTLASHRAVSFPCDGTALQAQLEQWTNVAFDFDSPDFGSDPAPPTPFDDNNKLLQEDPSSSSKLASSRFTPRGGESLFNAVQTPSLPSNALNVSSQLNNEQEISTVDLSALLGSSKPEDFNGSLVDPALALPNFHDASAALPSAFFTSPSAFDSSSLPAPPPSTIFDHEVEEHAPSPSTSTASSSKGKKSSAPAAKKKRAPAVEKVKALPLPEGINTDGMTEEELNNLAIEEDKRRRNTAASGELPLNYTFACSASDSFPRLPRSSFPSQEEAT